ncbi:MAG: hypothetical protein JXA46_04020 [Dehalococcoidales bacterium]|nr:hypothetical protein [Dehalococcoidales bacterium]
MRIYNKLIFTLAAVFGCITVLLTCLGQKDLAVYFIAYAIAYLVITLLYVYLNRKARAALNALSAVIFAGFLFIVAVKVMEILK